MSLLIKVFPCMKDVKNIVGFSTKIVIGDHVRVCKGDLENLLAVVSSINGDMVTIIPNHKDLKVEMSLTVLFMKM